MKFSLAALACLAAPAASEIYFKEQFNDADWEKRWTPSTTWKSKSDMGEWNTVQGKWNGGEESDLGLQTSPDAKFFGISAAMSKPYSSKDKKDLIIQYTVKHEQKIDCGGAYIKLLPGGNKFDSAKFGGDTPYKIMFGPDICGQSKRTHTILNYPPKKDNVMITKDISCESDELSHLYTLTIKPDNTFEVKVDNKVVREGKLEDEFEMLEPKTIKDPDQSKPEDWVDEKMIADPESIKPEGYDDIPSELPDPDAKKPDDWDDEDDGEWEPPMIDNPEFKGPWEPEMMKNPDYKGPWVHPMIDNPEYKPDDNLYAVCDEECTHVGFELWQVKAGTIFDDIIVTDSAEEAQQFAEETFHKKREGEKTKFDAIKEEEAKAQEQQDTEGLDDFDDEDMDMDDHDEF